MCEDFLTEATKLHDELVKYALRYAQFHVGTGISNLKSSLAHELDIENSHVIHSHPQMQSLMSLEESVTKLGSHVSLLYDYCKTQREE